MYIGSGIDTDENIRMFKDHKHILYWLLALSFIIRTLVAGLIELGNDEVYYRTYALYPDWSHFDHPPMVGWIIQLFTLDLLFQDELFLRLGSVVFGTLNTYLVYRIGSFVRNERTGLIAAFLFTASIYCFVIAGTFILPDTPQMLFWLLALLFFIKAFQEPVSEYCWIWMTGAGFFTGLGMLSKYTTVFLWVGVLAYIFLYSRKWLRKPCFYISMAITLLLFMPVIFWNVGNNWISFTFQGERVNMFESGLRFDYFFTELLGQFFYNNPLNFIIIASAFFALTRRRNFLEKKWVRLLLWTSLPLIATFLFFALFRRTLPHWSAPGYTGLLIVAGAWLDSRFAGKRIIPYPVVAALAFLLIILVAGILQIRTGALFYDSKNLGKNDLTLDLYGWEQLSRKFHNEVLSRDTFEHMPIVSHRWFPAANLDYYVARPNNTYVLGLGSLEKIHKYAWINNMRGGFEKGMDAWYITTSRDFHNPEILYSQYFRRIMPVDTINIERGNKTVMQAYVFLLRDMVNVPENQISAK